MVEPKKVLSKVNLMYIMIFKRDRNAPLQAEGTAGTNVFGLKRGLQGWCVKMGQLDGLWAKLRLELKAEDELYNYSFLS